MTDQKELLEIESTAEQGKHVLYIPILFKRSTENQDIMIKILSFLKETYPKDEWSELNNKLTRYIGSVDTGEKEFDNRFINKDGDVFSVISGPGYTNGPRNYKFCDYFQKKDQEDEASFNKKKKENNNESLGIKKISKIVRDFVETNYKKVVLGDLDQNNID